VPAAYIGAAAANKTGVQILVILSFFEQHVTVTIVTRLNAHLVAHQQLRAGQP
jgi:hypothetical protein